MSPTSGRTGKPRSSFVQGNGSLHAAASVANCKKTCQTVATHFVRTFVCDQYACVCRGNKPFERSLFNHMTRNHTKSGISFWGCRGNALQTPLEPHLHTFHTWKLQLEIIFGSNPPTPPTNSKRRVLTLNGGLLWYLLLRSTAHGAFKTSELQFAVWFLAC